MKSLIVLVASFGLFVCPMMGFSEIVIQPAQPSTHVAPQTDTSRDMRFDSSRSTSTFGTERHLDSDHQFNKDARFNVDVQDTKVVRGGDVLMNVRTLIRDDPALAQTVDALVCEDSVILFGVVPSATLKANLESKIKGVSGVAKLDNRIIVK